MVRIRLEPAWHIGPTGSEPLDPSMFRLLRSIHEMGTLTQAARAAGLSYRHAWSQMGKWERMLGRPLAKLERGRGASLTAFGERLLRAEQEALRQLSSPLAKLSEDLERDLGEIAPEPPPKLVIHASHDLALAQLLEAPALGEKLELDLHFHGSLENLVALSRGRCDLAGFHVAEQESVPQFARLLKPGVHKLIGVAVREQGLMVTRGNPKDIQSLQDLTRHGVRFINRQQGSGTRVAFDQLLASAGIERSRVGGYPTEEFTHLAVAAIVASGKADAGFGIHAAAAQHDLGFIPLMSERYLLACNAERLESREMREFLALLRGRRFGQILAELRGYDGAICGKVMDIGEGITGPRPAGNRPRRGSSPDTRES